MRSGSTAKRLDGAGGEAEEVRGLARREPVERAGPQHRAQAVDHAPDGDPPDPRADVTVAPEAPGVAPPARRRPARSRRPAPRRRSAGRGAAPAMAHAARTARAGRCTSPPSIAASSSGSEPMAPRVRSGEPRTPPDEVASTNGSPVSGSRRAVAALGGSAAAHRRRRSAGYDRSSSIRRIAAGRARQIDDEVLQAPPLVVNVPRRGPSSGRPGPADVRQRLAGVLAPEPGGTAVLELEIRADLAEQASDRLHELVE